MVQEKKVVVLPKAPSEVDTRWTSQKSLFIGPPGIGKSEFWSFDPKNLFIQCEAGLNHLSVMKVPCYSWADWESTVLALFEAKKKGEFIYETITIDTIDKLVDFANDEAVERGRSKYKSADINTVGDIPNGTGWSWSTALIESALSDLEKLQVHVVIIGHLERKEIKKPNNVSINLETIGIGGRTGRMLASWPDHFLNIEAGFKGSEMVRRVRSLPSGTVEAKSRGGLVPDGWIWDKNMKVNFDKFRGLFK